MGKDQIVEQSQILKFLNPFSGETLYVRLHDSEDAATVAIKVDVWANAMIEGSPPPLKKTHSDDTCSDSNRYRLLAEERLAMLQETEKLLRWSREKVFEKITATRMRG